MRWHVRYTVKWENATTDGKDFDTFEEAHRFWQAQAGYRRLLLHIEGSTWLDVLPNGYVGMAPPAPGTADPHEGGRWTADCGTSECRGGWAYGSGDPACPTCAGSEGHPWPGPPDPGSEGRGALAGAIATGCGLTIDGERVLCDDHRAPADVRQDRCDCREIVRAAAPFLAGPADPKAEGMTPAEAWQDLLDKDDRTSPEDYPDHALITFDELAAYMAAAGPPVPATGDWERLLEVCRATAAAHEDLFRQCLSNGMKNAWGKDVNCTAINKAGELAQSALRRFNGPPDPQSDGP